MTLSQFRDSIQSLYDTFEQRDMDGADVTSFEVSISLEPQAVVRNVHLDLENKLIGIE